MKLNEDLSQEDSIKHNCPSCGGKASVNDVKSHGGKCPHCGHAFGNRIIPTFCGWCKDYMGGLKTKNPELGSHGICSDCYGSLIKKIKKDRPTVNESNFDEFIREYVENEIIRRI